MRLPSRRFLAMAGAGRRQWDVDAFPRGTTVHTAGRQGWSYVHLHADVPTYLAFSNFCGERFVFSERWQLQGELYPRTRIYLRTENISELAARWRDFVTVYQAEAA